MQYSPWFLLASFMSLFHQYKYDIQSFIGIIGGRMVIESQCSLFELTPNKLQERGCEGRGYYKRP